MTIKSILCVFGSTPEELHALDIAFELGKLHEAHIRFLHISIDPKTYIYSEDIIGFETVIGQLEEENHARLTRAKRYVSDFAAKHDVVLDSANVPSHLVSAQFLHMTGAIYDLVAQEGRLSDLIIIGRGMSPTGMSDEAAVLAALFGTGRPLLLVPMTADHVFVPWQDKAIMLAWNGSREASRAIHDAMPYLERAEKLYVIEAHEPRRASDVTSSLALTNYLRTHDIRITDVLSFDSGDETIGEALMRRAKELKADLLVMGAYGHNRYREMLFGGVTRDLLDNADIPLLLSH